MLQGYSKLSRKSSGSGWSNSSRATNFPFKRPGTRGSALGAMGTSFACFRDDDLFARRGAFDQALQLRFCVVDIVSARHDVRFYWLAKLVKFLNWLTEGNRACPNFNPNISSPSP